MRSAKSESAEEGDGRGQGMSEPNAGSGLSSEGNFARKLLGSLGLSKLKLRTCGPDSESGQGAHTPIGSGSPNPKKFFSPQGKRPTTIMDDRDSAGIDPLSPLGFKQQPVAYGGHDMDRDTRSTDRSSRFTDRSSMISDRSSGRDSAMEKAGSKQKGGAGYWASGSKDRDSATMAAQQLMPRGSAGAAAAAAHGKGATATMPAPGHAQPPIGAAVPLPSAKISSVQTLSGPTALQPITCLVPAHRESEEAVEISKAATPPGNSTPRKGRFSSMQRNIQRYIKNIVSSPTGSPRSPMSPNSPSPVSSSIPAHTPALRLPRLSPPLHATHTSRGNHTPTRPEVPVDLTRLAESGHTSAASRAQAASRGPRTEIIAMAELRFLPVGMNRETWCIEDYTQLVKIHSGYASSVYTGRCRLSGDMVALKVYSPSLLHPISQHQLLRESRIHVTLDHQNIVRLYAAFKQGDIVVLVQEYADGGDLLQLLLKSGTRLNEEITISLVVQPLLKAILHLHNQSIAHRDVKLENIVFAHGKAQVLKIGDFGLCINLREERSVTRAGTLDYMAPEILLCPTKSYPEENKQRADLACTLAVDIWALGVMVYELLNGCPPFTRPERKDTERVIKRAKPPAFLAATSPLAIDFVHACLQKDPIKRPTAWQLEQHPWVLSLSQPAEYVELVPQPMVLSSLSASTTQFASPAAVAAAVHGRQLQKWATAGASNSQASTMHVAAEAASSAVEWEKSEDRSSAPARPLELVSKASGPRMDTIQETVRDMVLPPKTG